MKRTADDVRPVADAEKPRGFRQSMAWLHTWAGLLVGWVLFMVFAFGTLSYYRTSITDWMQPERLLPARSVPLATDSLGGNTPVAAQSRATTQAVDWLAAHAANASRWTIWLPGSGVTNATVSWEGPGGYQTRILPGANGLTPRATEGGDFFYNFHFQLRYLPIVVARWIVGTCAMFMLVAIISGVVTHRRIFVDFFTFRPGKGQRSWLDAHNVSAVLALPYHLMITYTGLATLMVILMPWGLKERYPAQGALLAFYGEAYDFALAGKPSGTPQALPPVPPLLEAARTGFGGHEAATITIDNPGDAAAQVKISRGSDARLSVAPESVTYDVAGNVIARHEGDNAAARTVGVMIGLHEARFAPAVLRLVFFLSGLAGTLMVASGLIIWTRKLRQKCVTHGTRFHPGLWLVERLNLATIGGLPLAGVAYFYANRLIPAMQPGRATLEVQVFFAAWAASAVFAVLTGGRLGWRLLAGAGALAFAALPVVDRIAIGAWVMPGFDAALLGAAAVLATMTGYLLKKPLPSKQASKAAAAKKTTPAAKVDKPGKADGVERAEGQRTRPADIHRVDASTGAPPETR